MSQSARDRWIEELEPASGPKWVRDSIEDIKETGRTPVVTQALRVMALVGLPVALQHPVAASLFRVIQLIRGGGSAVGKPWYKSKTIIANLVAAAGSLLTIWGVDLPSEVQAEIVTLVMAGVNLALRLVTSEAISR